MRRTWIVVGSGFACLLLLYGSFSALNLLAHEDRELHERFEAAGIAVIDLDVGDGTVLVVGDESTAVRVDARISDGLKSTRVSARVVDDRLVVTSACPAFSQHCSVDWVLHAPPTVRVQLRSSDAEVEVRGVGGGVDATTRDGDVLLADVDGAVSATTTDGTVRAVGLGGGPVSASTRDGDVELGFSEPPDSVVAESTDGSVTIAVPAGSGPYSVSTDTTNGDVVTPVRTDPSSPRSIDVRTRDGDLTVRYAVD